MTGVYKITNLNNQKKYIGQSKDIFRRWKSHTSALNNNSDETIVRMAFAKYGLRQQVSSEGIYSNFKFEIIEECLKEKLLEREYYFIAKEKPEYNIMCAPPNELFIKKYKRTKNAGKYFIQYHNFDREQPQG